MPEYTMYILGLMTLPLVAVVLVLSVAAKESIEGWWRNRTIAVAAYARCPIRGCGHTCVSYGAHLPKRRVRQMMREHVGEAHAESTGSEHGGAGGG